jgi:hypothetical protein
MIAGHENNTFELSNDEIELANKIIPFFKLKTKDNPVKAKVIVDGVNRVYELTPKFTDVRLRKIINYYRCNGIIPIISSSKGYYVSYYQEDIEYMIESLNQRARSIQNCARGLEQFNTFGKLVLKEVTHMTIIS